MGSSKTQKTDVRVIAASNKDLLQLVQQGRFREDLYYRLSTVPIRVPALHDRPEDIHLLFRKFAGDFANVILSVVKDPSMMGLSEPLNIGQHFGVSVRELVDLIVKSMKFSGKVIYDYNMPDGAPRKVMSDIRFKKLFPHFVFTA